MIGEKEMNRIQGEQLGDTHKDDGFYKGNEYTPDRWTKGIAGERAIGKLFGLDTEVIPGARSDGGKDYRLLLETDDGLRWFTIDAKAAERPTALVVECWRDPKADIYALCQYFPDKGIAEPLGWAWRSVLRSRIEHFRGMRDEHFTVFRKDLRLMSELVERFRKGEVK